MIKLSTIRTEYITDNKTFVKCILKTKLIDNKDRTIKPMSLFPFIGVAKLHKEDKFDYQIGYRIALAKAERIAYKMVNKIMVEEYQNLNNLITDIHDFIYRAENIVEHNTEYIKKLSNCSEEE